ncbi:MAG: hypothetical protein AAGM67_20195, partial [Bacteroidota bacterium]
RKNAGFVIITQPRRLDFSLGAVKDSLARQLAYEIAQPTDPNLLRSALDEYCADDIVLEDFYYSDSFVGKENVISHMVERVRRLPIDSRIVVDDVTDGSRASGWIWHLEKGGEIGIRGTTYMEVNSRGEICYMRKGTEPLFKPGSSTASLLKAIAKPDLENPRKADPNLNLSPKTQKASDLVRFLWLQYQYEAKATDVLPFFTEDIVYQDFTFPKVKIYMC